MEARGTVTVPFASPRELWRAVDRLGLAVTSSRVEGDVCTSATVRGNALIIEVEPEAPDSYRVDASTAFCDVRTGARVDREPLLFDEMYRMTFAPRDARSPRIALTSM